MKKIFTVACWLDKDAPLFARLSEIPYELGTTSIAVPNELWSNAEFINDVMKEVHIMNVEQGFIEASALLSAVHKALELRLLK